MEGKRKQPLGIELVKRGIVTEDDIAKDRAKKENRRYFKHIKGMWPICANWCNGGNIRRKSNLFKRIRYKG